MPARGGFSSIILVALVACNSAVIVDRDDDDIDAGLTPASGGAAGSGGAPSSGGSASEGGGPSTGGAPSAGGGPSEGGGPSNDPPACVADPTMPTGTPTILVDGLTQPISIALAGDSAYVTEFGYGDDSGALLRVPKLGGAFERVVQNQPGPWAIAASDEYVYWSNQGVSSSPVSRFSLADGSVDLITADVYSWGLAPFGGSLYVSDIGGKLVTSGPDLSLDVLATVPGSTVGVAADETGVYVSFISQVNGYAPIRRYDSDGSFSDLYGNIAQALQLLLDGDYLYFANSGAIQRGTREGAPLVTLANLGAPLAGSAVADCYFYFTTTADGSIGRVPLTGGDVQILATGQPQPEGIAVDSEAIYWVNHAAGVVPLSGQVVRLAK
jgi:hypothetical protein